MKTILQINTVANWGSTGKIVEQIGVIAQRNGWKSYIAYGRDNGKTESKSKLIKIGRKNDTLIHYLFSLMFDMQGLLSKRSTLKLIKTIKEIKPDIVHLHNIHGYYINYQLLFNYLSEAKIPVVWTLHDCWAFTGHCTYFDIIGCEKWKVGCERCLNLKDYPKSVLLDRSHRNYNLKKSLFASIENLTIVPVSEWLGKLVSQSFLQSKQINVIHNGIDLNVFRLKNNELRRILNLEKKFVVLGVASNGFGGRKGLGDFIHLSKMLPDEFQIVMIGLHKDELKVLPENIIGKTRTANVEELVDFYNMADVFINPTYSDNFPTTNIEALACGTPVVTYNTGGSPEAIDSQSGIVVEKGNLDSLLKAIVSLKNNNLSSLYCRERAEKLYNKDDRYDEYIKMYENILKK